MPRAGEASLRLAHVVVAIACGAGVLILPAQAWALPGPEVVAPLAAGIAQLLLALGWLAGRLQRRWQRSRWRWVVLLAIGAVFGLLVNEEAAVLAIVLAGAMGAVGPAARWRWATALVLWLGTAAFCLDPGQSPPDLRAYGPNAEPEGPLPHASLPRLRSGPVLLVHVGEPEEFANCRASIGTVLRSADVVAALDGLRAKDAPVVLVVPPGGNASDVQAAARGLGDVQVLPFQQAFSRPPQDGSVCYDPPLAQAFHLLVPKALLPTRAPSAPLRLDWAPWLRPVDLSHLLASRPQVRLIDADRVMQTPSSKLAEWRGAPAVLVGEDVRRLSAAGRLLRGQGVELIAMGHGRVPAPRLGVPLGAVQLVWFILLAAVSVLVMRALARFAAVRSEVAHATGRVPAWLAPVLRLAGELSAIGACAFWALQAAGMVAPVPLAMWITPTMVSRTALYVGVACLGLVGVALWLTVVRFTGGWRLAAAVAAAVLLLATLPGMVTGSGLLPVHFAVVAAGLLGAWLSGRAIEALWRRIRRVRAGARSAWLWLDHADDLVAAGGKAARLGTLRRRGLPVPPGIVVWTDWQGRPPRSALRATRLLLGAGPLLVRSTARAEDREQETAAGRFPSRVCKTFAQLRETIRGVASTYASLDAQRPAVLVMPLVACTRGGVAQAPVPGTSAVLVEEGAGRDSVTSGQAAHRLYWGRHSRRWLGEQVIGAELQSVAKLLDQIEAQWGPEPRYAEWLARHGRSWLVQDRAAPASVRAASDCGVEELLQQVERPSDPDAPWLRRVANDGLPRTASMRTARLWAQCWRRADALGDAFVLLGLPRALAPEQAVVAAWGAPWAIVPHVDVMMRMVRLRVGASAVLRLRALASGANALARRVLTRPSSLREAVARSMALRMLEPFLPEDKVLPRLPPGVELVGALREVDSPEALPRRWGHRGTWDLDPACPRYGERADPQWQPPEPGPSWPPADLPKECGRQWSAALRDGLHDWLAWEVAIMRAADGSWNHAQPYAASAPGLESMSLRDAEAVGLPLEGRAEGRSGTWVSGSGPIEGVAERDPQQAGANRILLIDVPTPELAACFVGFGAVVSASGGALSHAALVARELGVPALFGVGCGVEQGDGRVRLEADGSVVWPDRKSCG